MADLRDRRAPDNPVERVGELLGAKPGLAEPDKFPKAIAKAAKNNSVQLEGENNYGDDKKNWAQDDAHRPQDRPEDSPCYSQDRKEDGPRYSQDRTEDGAHCSQDWTKDGPR